jgi:hypothetical protein
MTACGGLSICQTAHGELRANSHSGNTDEVAAIDIHLVSQLRLRRFGKARLQQLPSRQRQPDGVESVA